MNGIILFLAQGFGVGKIPVAPGTFGSLIGLVWFWILLLPKSPIIFCIGIVASIFASVWICGEGEKILNQRDPGSIVFDEIIAIPICFGVWIGTTYYQTKIWPSLKYVFENGNVWWMVVIFVLFRIFDIAKPWPIRQSQALPGGWGVTMDDVLAAIYVNAIVALMPFLISCEKK